MRSRIPQFAVFALANLCLQVTVAQDNEVFELGYPGFSAFTAKPSAIADDDAPLISIAHTSEEKDFQGAVVEDALQYNLGMQFTPVSGLKFRADAWGLQVNEAPATGSVAGGLPKLYIEDSVINEFNLDSPILGKNVETNGFDLGASYAWDTNRFGQFTLRTKATYVQEFENKGGILDLASSELNAIDEKMISPEIQSSLMLTWELGNHSATAGTNYFDSYKDISELDLQEINDLVDNITTIDFQYGYSVKTGAKDRAIIEFGIRNVFDERTQQLLNSSARILDQNGRVAYGSIKYQF